MTVVDLGAAPGSWSQVVKEKLMGPDGKIQGRAIALDILPMDPIEGVNFIQETSVNRKLQISLPNFFKEKKLMLYSLIWPRTFQVWQLQTPHVVCF